MQGFDQNWAIEHTVHLYGSDDHIRFLESILWSENWDFIQQRRGLAIPIDLIQAKPNDVLSNRGITHECTRGADARALSVLPGHASGWHT
ncbi:MAG: hypothetical protein NVSMB27_26220 [Ktedonobacteraceae bacterium]